MVSAVGLPTKSKGSHRKRKPKLIPNVCDFCHHDYKGSRQSRYCSEYCVESACRARKEALIDALARLMFAHTTRATWAEALALASEWVRLYHKPIKQRMVALGYSYSESDRKWVR